MKILRLLGITLIMLGMFLGNTVLARDFSLADFKGPYAYVYDGSISIPNPDTGQLQSIATASVGQVESTGEDSDGNGWGEATVSSVTMNIGGLIILNFASITPGSAIYSVNNSTGVGVASAEVVLTKPPTFPLGPEALPPGIDASGFTGTAVFNFALVIDVDGTVNLVGTRFSTKDSSGQTTLIPTLGRGTLEPQESDSTQ